MKILGVDPGTRFMGYGVLEKQGHGFKVWDYGVINASKIEAFPERLLHLYQQLSHVIEKNHADVLALEEVFYGKNFKSAVKIGEARGIAILCAAQSHLPFYEYAPTIIKKAVTGNGRADKTQVEKMVRLMLGIGEIEKADATDALAIALCHCHRDGLIL